MAAPEKALEMITFPLTKKRLMNILSENEKANLFCFRCDPFVVVEENDYTIGK